MFLPNEISSMPEFDVFLSAYNESERVNRVFTEIRAARKIWIIHPEYGGLNPLRGEDSRIFRVAKDELPLDALRRIMEGVGLFGADRAMSVGVDITGLLRPFVLTLAFMFRELGFGRVTYIYSDPFTYSAGFRTTFSTGALYPVESIPGFEGIHEPNLDATDALIIGAGYDSRLIRAVAEYKRSAEHFVLFGLPGLQPHMYQESQLRVAEARESIHNYGSHKTALYAPADDPYITAEILSQQITKIRSGSPTRNVYLSPVGPKTQVLGFALYYLAECANTPTSILFPGSASYSTETSSGLSRVHLFEVEHVLLS